MKHLLSVPWALILLMAVSQPFLCGCGLFDDEPDTVQRTRMELTGDYLDTLLVIPDNCDVVVNGHVRMLDERDSSLVIGHDVVFLMQEAAELNLFSQPIVAIGTPPIVRSDVAGELWRRFTLEGNSRFYLDGWSFRDGRDGLHVNGNVAHLQDCEFSDLLIYGVYSNVTDSITIDQCQFTNCSTAFYTDNGHAVVTHSSFSAGTAGQYGVCNQEAGLVLQDCTIDGYASAGLWLDGDGASASYNTVEHCLFQNCSDGVFNGTGRWFIFRYNIVQNCVWHGVRIRLQNTGMPLVIESNNLLPCSNGWPLRFDNGPDLIATNNWWGSADAEVVGQRIYDSRLNPQGNGFVVYEPFATQPFAGLGPRN